MVAAGAGDGDEGVGHLETTFFVAAPPATESGSVYQLWCFILGFSLSTIDIAWRYFFYFSVALVYEESAYDTGAPVHVFVVTPCCEIDVPVVELEGDVAHCVG